MSGNVSYIDRVWLATVYITSGNVSYIDRVGLFATYSVAGNASYIGRVEVVTVYIVRDISLRVYVHVDALPCLIQ